MLTGVHLLLTYRHVSACHLCYRVREALLDRLPRHLGPGQVYGREG